MPDLVWGYCWYKFAFLLDTMLGVAITTYSHVGSFLRHARRLKAMLRVATMANSHVGSFLSYASRL